MPKFDPNFEYKPKTGAARLAYANHILSYADSSDVKFDWWQGIYMKSEDDFLIANKSRRIGWSYITAIKGLVSALDPAVSGYTKQYVSYSLEDATEKIRVAAEFYDSMPEMIKPKKLISRTRTHLEFSDRNGRSISRLISLPCRPPRGKGGSISLDEYAFHQKDDEIYTAAIAVTSRGGSIEIGSTPFGNKGRFYEIMIDEGRQYSDYKRYNIPWWMSPALCTDVETAVIDKNLTTEQRVKKYGTDKLQSIMRSMPVEDFQQEYECLYRDEKAAFITFEMIKACTPLGGSDNSEEDTIEIIPFRDLDSFSLAYDPAIHGNLYAGYDVGRTNDASELIIIGYDRGTKLRTVWGLITRKKTGFDEQEDLLCQLLTKLPVHRLCIDATGLGMDLAERMTRKYPRKVEGCTFSNEFKEDISNAMWIGFNRLEFRLPADKQLATQIHSIKKIVTSGKHARFDCDRNGKNGHGDKYWAMALANHAIGDGEGATGGQFYKKYREAHTPGSNAPRGRSQRAVLSSMYRLYRGDPARDKGSEES